MTFDPIAMCEVLAEEGVDFVVVGGFAAIIHGSPLPTEDLDVLPARTRDNLERLARALRRLDAKIRTSAEPVATNLDAGFIANMPHMLNLVTRYGDMDLVFTPAGPLTGFDEWSKQARAALLRTGLVVTVASLDDVIASKQAANRPKDQRSLPYLESLRDEIERAARDD
jgi:hypothetical protein